MEIKKSFQRVILKENIPGAKRFSNYGFSIILIIGGFGFFITGVSSFFNLNPLWFINLENIKFIPQGIVMIFYGTTAILLGSFLLVTIIWDIGGGYNEYNKEEEQITLFRFGFPGKYRKILIQYKMDQIKALQVNIKEGLNPKRELYLRTKDQKYIPITPIGAPMILSELEERALELSQFIGVKVEGL
jgi:hypothetical protein